jgi:hypothetical protein
MHRIAALAITSVLAAVTLSGCTLAHGPVSSEERDIDLATTVVLDVSGDVTISEGEPALVIHASQSVLDLLTSDVRDGVLTLGAGPRTPSFLLGEIRYELTLPGIERIEINGSGDIDSDVPAGDLEIEINGSGDIDLSSIDASRVSLEISGSGDVELKGSTDEFAISIHGSGDIACDDLDAARVSVDIDGGGDVDVAASETLDVSISGSGTVVYSGRPEITQDISGSGEVRSR